MYYVLKFISFLNLKCTFSCLLSLVDSLEYKSWFWFDLDNTPLIIQTGLRSWFFFIWFGQNLYFFFNDQYVRACAGLYFFCQKLHTVCERLCGKKNKTILVGSKKEQFWWEAKDNDPVKCEVIGFDWEF